MEQQHYIFHSPIIDELPMDIPGIYNLGGGRQVGKTILLKQWTLRLYEGAKDQVSKRHQTSFEDDIFCYM